MAQRIFLRSRDVRALHDAPVTSTLADARELSAPELPACHDEAHPQTGDPPRMMVLKQPRNVPIIILAISAASTWRSWGIIRKVSQFFFFTDAV